MTQCKEQSVLCERQSFINQKGNVVRKAARYVFGKQNGRTTYEGSSRFRRVMKDWDRLCVLLCLIFYAISSLFGVPINVLQSESVPAVWVNLLMIELVIGAVLVIIGILTRYYGPQFIGAVICLFAIGTQFVIGVLVDGFTKGDLFVLSLFFSIFATVRRVRQKVRTTDEIIQIHQIVDQAAKDLKDEAAASGDEKR